MFALEEPIKHSGRQLINIDQEFVLISPLAFNKFGGNFLVDLLLDELSGRGLIVPENEVQNISWNAFSVVNNGNYYFLKLSAEDISSSVEKILKENPTWFEWTWPFICNQISKGVNEFVLACPVKNKFNFWVMINGVVVKLHSSTSSHTAIFDMFIEIESLVKTNLFHQALHPNHEDVFQSFESFKKFIFSVEISKYIYKEEPSYISVELNNDLYLAFLDYKAKIQTES